MAMLQTALFLIATGCTGGPSTTETVAAPPIPAITDARAPVAAPPPPVVVAADPSGKVKLDPALVQEIVRVRGEYDAIADAPALAKAWRDTIVLATKLEEALQPAFEKNNSELDLAWLLPSLPGLQNIAMAEGTALVFDLSTEAWAAKAAKTTDPVDDRFFELVAHVYQSARMHGYAAWEARTWDYGGCNTLGNGVVVDALKKADAARAAGNLFSAEIGEVRTRIFTAVLEDQPMFVYCDPSSNGATADTKLQDEARRIIADVKLSPDEKTKLEARIPKLKGAPFQGG